ncbi:diguanylate cyclase [Oxalobacter paraformigenes]|uniref:sensor domain-containing diguanylate cyclase n=1 Tax=Oxalobacter paraformigenes TaxID=556268 RepID=UPI001E29B988|nr:diguanylate cyclase [Oxalobacter paraformigenes]
MRTNILVCSIIFIGFFLTAVLSYRSNIGVFEKDIEQVSTLATEGIYAQIESIFSRPVSVSLTMANDHLLKTFLSSEKRSLNNPEYVAKMRQYLDAYRRKYRYDSVFLVSANTKRYYHFSGLNRTLEKNNPENTWYYSFIQDNDEYSLNIDNDEATDDSITVFVNCKIRNAHGSVMGVVGVGFKVDSLQKLLHAYDEQFNVEASLINDRGIVEVSSVTNGHENADFFTGNPLSGFRERILGSSDDPETFWYSLDGRDGYVITQYIPTLKWHLVVENDVSEIRNTFRRQLVMNLFIIVCVIVLVLFTITRLIKKYHAQIVELTVSQETEYQQLLHKATEKLYENIDEMDITRNRAGSETTRRYFEKLGMDGNVSYDEALKTIARRQIKEEFIPGYLEMFKSENILEKYRNGINNLSYDFLYSEDGKNYHWMRINAQIFFWKSDQSVRMVVYRKNIDAEKRREQGLLEETQKDPMTSLFNKRATEQLITECLENPLSMNSKHAFLILDIDHFKNINDNYGHAIGDEVITEFASELKSQFRNDDIVGRIGGDEFVVLLRDYDRLETIREKLDRLCTKFARKNYGKKSFHISTSIGAALYPEQGASYPELYEKADQALYYSKTHGRGGFTIFGKEASVVDASRVDPRDLETLLHNATDGIAKFACTDDFHLLYYNRKWAELTGIPDSLLSSRSFRGLSLVHPEDREKTRAVISVAMESKTPFTLYFRLKHHDGHAIPVRFNGWFVSELYENRNPVFYGIYTDLSHVAATSL